MKNELLEYMTSWDMCNASEHVKNMEDIVNKKWQNIMEVN